MTEIAPQNLRINLHVGAHKTATTHLQTTLGKNKALLRQSGVRFYGPRQLRGKGKPLPQRFGIHGRKKNDNGLSVEQELGKMVGGAQKLVVSEENLLGPRWHSEGDAHGPLYPECDSRLEELIPCFGGRTLSLFFAVRSPAEYLMSSYGQFLLGGRIKTFKEFSEGLELTELRWSNAIRRMSLVPGVSEIYVWQYEDYPANFKQLIRKMIGWKFGVKIMPNPSRVHSGLSDQAVAQVLGNQAKVLKREARTKFARAARDAFPMSETDPRYSPWKSDEIREAAEVYRKDFQEISKMEKVSIIRPQRNLKKTKTL